MAEQKALAVGLKHSAKLAVGEHLTVPNVPADFGSFRDMPEVLATAYMVLFVEVTCADAVRPYLSAGQKTVGTHVNMSHCAATPSGMEVIADIELIEVDGRKLTFKVECRDEHEVIGTGTHERFIIDAQKFTDRVSVKAAA